MTESLNIGDGWQEAIITETVARTPDIKSFFLKLSAPFRYQAGQHIDLRLTAPDGYTAIRSYSIASAPDQSGIIELAIERLPDGEVSGFLHEVALTGDKIEVKGPLGGHFIWPGNNTQPILLIGAGSGLVPLMSMIRHRNAVAPSIPVALLLSARTLGDALFFDELVMAEEAYPGFNFALTVTRERPTRELDFGRRVDGPMVADVTRRLPDLPSKVFVCGSNSFVEVAVEGAIAAGIDASMIATERYGA